MISKSFACVVFKTNFENLQVLFSSRVFKKSEVVLSKVDQAFFGSFTLELIPLKMSHSPAVCSHGISRKFLLRLLSRAGWNNFYEILPSFRSKLLRIIHDTSGFILGF